MTKVLAAFLSLCRQIPGDKTQVSSKMVFIQNLLQFIYQPIILRCITFNSDVIVQQPTKKKNKRAYYRSMWYAVAQLVEVLRYKPEGREFDSR